MGFTIKHIHWIELMIQMERSDTGLRQRLKTNMSVIHMSRKWINTMEVTDSVVRKVKGAIESASVMGGDRKSNKETWSDTEIKMVWEKRHGRSEPHTTGQGSP